MDLKSGGRVIHKQTFQNSNQMVEVVIRTKPKQPIGKVVYPKPKPFVRNCALQTELEKINDKASSPSGKGRSHTKKDSKHGQRMTVEVSKTKKHSKKKHENSADVTWADILRSHSIIKEDSDCSSNTSIDKVPSNNYDEVDVQEKRNRVHHSKGTKLDKINTSSVKSISQLDNNYFISRNIVQAARNENAVSDLINRCSSTQLEQPARTDRRNEVKQTEERAPVTKEANGSHRPEDGQRLLSDGLCSTPFSDSALKLLRQLKQKLIKRGDSESSEALDVLEQFIAGNSQPSQNAQTASQLESVFGTPALGAAQQPSNMPVHDEQLQQALREQAQLREENARQAAIITELRELSGRLLSEHQHQKETARTVPPPLDSARGLLPRTTIATSASGDTRALRTALLRLHTENELMRRQLEQTRPAAVRSNPVVDHNILPSNTDAPGPTSDADSAFDERFSSQAASKQPSPACAHLEEHQTPALLVNNENVPPTNTATNPNLRDVIGTCSTQLNTDMIATEAILRNQATLRDSLRNASTLRPQPTQEQPNTSDPAGDLIRLRQRYEERLTLGNFNQSSHIADESINETSALSADEPGSTARSVLREKKTDPKSMYAPKDFYSLGPLEASSINSSIQKNNKGNFTNSIITTDVSSSDVSTRHQKQSVMAPSSSSHPVTRPLESTRMNEATPNVVRYTGAETQATPYSLVSFTQLQPELDSMAI